MSINNTLSQCSGQLCDPTLKIEESLADVTLENLALAMMLFAFCFATVFGNALVIAAVARERYLHTVTNYLITSLAVADCLVGSIVMPFSAAYQLFDQHWIFGQDLCDVWHSFDVLASTASILNLCIISMDRYWAITDPFTYPSRMTPKKACCYIALAWVCSSVISFPAIAWWRAVAASQDVVAPSTGNDTAKSLYDQCVFTDDVGYLVFSSIISFYGPLLVMVFTYYRIYSAAVAQSRSLRLGIKQVSVEGNGDVELTLRMHRGGGAGHAAARAAAAYGPRSLLFRPTNIYHTNSNVDTISEATTSLQDTASVNSPENVTGSRSASSCFHNDSTHELQRSAQNCSIVAETISLAVSSTNAARPAAMAKMNFSVSRKLAKIAKERKAAKTLGIVMGVFIACWLPFFVTNLLSGICHQCIANPDRVVTVVNWLGWLNSGMNPAIYACWSRDFRRAFARILCACCPRLFHRWKRHSTKTKINLSDRCMSVNQLD